ncbi:MAG: hypothetical protein M1520_00925 [Candidatus Marsarchaeota archaeon]|nr:hypothetical protein [Candidatus Marsarchaeota archaeon]
MNTTRVRNWTESDKPEISKPVAKLYRGGYVAGGALGGIIGAYVSGGHVTLEGSVVFLAVAAAGLVITAAGKEEHLGELKKSKRE